MCGARRQRAKRAKPSRPLLRQIDQNNSLYLALPSSPAHRKDPPELLKVATVSAQLVCPAALHDSSSIDEVASVCGILMKGRITAEVLNQIWTISKILIAQIAQLRKALGVGVSSLLQSVHVRWTDLENEIERLTANLLPGMKRFVFVALCSIIAEWYRTHNEVSLMRWHEVKPRVKSKCVSCAGFDCLLDALMEVAACFNIRRDCIQDPSNPGRCLHTQAFEANLPSLIFSEFSSLQ